MSEKLTRLLDLAILYEKVARSVYRERGPLVLQPAQWSSLRFFGAAEESARTVSGLARHLDVTLAPASRAAGSLQRRGLIEPRPHPEDRRSQLYDITSLGQERLNDDPLKRLARAFERITAEDLAIFSQMLEQFAKDLADTSVD